MKCRESVREPNSLPYERCWNQREDVNSKGASSFRCFYPSLVLGLTGPSVVDEIGEVKACGDCDVAVLNGGWMSKFIGTNRKPGVTYGPIG